MEKALPTPAKPAWITRQFLLRRKGVAQAYLVACSFRSAPDLIVASPFSRAASTAMATVAKFIAVIGSGAVVQKSGNDDE